MKYLNTFIAMSLLAGLVSSGQIEPTWESLAKNYHVPQWFVDGKIVVKIKDGSQGENHIDFSQNDIRFTTKNGMLYSFVLARPVEDIEIKTLAIGGLLDRKIAAIDLMGSSENILWKRSAESLTIQLPNTMPGRIVNGFRIHLK